MKTVKELYNFIIDTKTNKLDKLIGEEVRFNSSKCIITAIEFIELRDNMIYYTVHTHENYPGSILIKISINDLIDAIDIGSINGKLIALGKNNKISNLF